MPRHHRAFLRHLAANPRPLRALVEQVTAPDKTGAARNVDLLEGYNEAVRALRQFRDSHLKIVALYIVGPSRRVAACIRQMAAPATGTSPSGSSESSSSSKKSLSPSDSSSHTSQSTDPTPASASTESAPGSNAKDVLEKGTGGTLLMPFLKSVRDRPAEAEFVDRTR